MKLNGVLFLSSVLLFLYGVQPFLQTLDPSGLFAGFVNLFFLLFWVFPVYLGSIVFNAKWINEIYTETMKVQGKAFKKSGQSGLRATSDMIYRTIIVFVFIFLSVLLVKLVSLVSLHAATGLQIVL